MPRPRALADSQARPKTAAMAVCFASWQCSACQNQLLTGSLPAPNGSSSCCDPRPLQLIQVNPRPLWDCGRWCCQCPAGQHAGQPRRLWNCCQWCCRWWFFAGLPTNLPPAETAWRDPPGASGSGRGVQQQFWTVESADNGLTDDPVVKK